MTRKKIAAKTTMGRWSRRYAVAVGAVFSAGLVIAACQIHRNRYLAHGMYRISLYMLRDACNKWFLIAIAFLAMTVMVRRLLGQAVEMKAAARSMLAPVVMVMAINAIGFLDARLVVRPGPNVILISIDALRYDALGVNGCVIKGITPNIDRFAGNAVNFKTCIAQSSWTLPSHVTLMTSLYPETHKMVSPFRDGTSLDPAVVTLAETLRNEGYLTYAITGGMFVDSKFGFGQGFVRYDNKSWLLEDGFAALKRRLAAVKNGKFFIFFHTYEVHAPYRHTHYLDTLIARGIVSPAQKEMLEQYLSKELLPVLRSKPDTEKFEDALKELQLYNKEVAQALYWGGVRAVDGYFGQLLTLLKDLDLLRQTAIIFTSDHGEEFAEHNSACFYDSHHMGLFDEHVRVPLLIHMPGAGIRQGANRPEQVGLIDIMPTLLRFCAITPKDRLAGSDIMEYLNGDQEAVAARPMFSSVAVAGFKTGDVAMSALRLPGMKYISNHRGTFEPKGEGLYDLQGDPGETVNLCTQDPLRCREFARTLDGHAAEAAHFVETRPSQNILDDQLRAALRSLGYLE